MKRVKASYLKSLKLSQACLTGILTQQKEMRRMKPKENTQAISQPSENQTDTENGAFNHPMNELLPSPVGELMGINATGKFTANACMNWQAYRDTGITIHSVIPGLDADLCRCPSCKARYPRGIYWYDERLRAPKKSREDF